jgi:hypothetical protein
LHFEAGQPIWVGPVDYWYRGYIAFSRGNAEIIAGTPGAINPIMDKPKRIHADERIEPNSKVGADSSDKVNDYHDILIVSAVYSGGEEPSRAMVLEAFVSQVKKHHAKTQFPRRRRSPIPRSP